jgi:transposase
MSVQHEEILAVYNQGPQAVVNLVERFLTIIEQQQQQIVAQQRTIEELTARVKQLEDQLAQNSHNSSKPPSSDSSTNRRKSLRTSTQRKPGGQKGHPGSTLIAVETPDRILIHSPSQCESCGTDLSEVEASEVVRRQVFDLPPMKLEVVEHQSQIKPCPACHHTNKGQFPIGVEATVQYGEAIRSLAVYLMNYQLLPFERASELIEDLLGCRMSVATLNDSIKRAYEELEQTQEIIKQSIAKAAVANFDETGFYIAGNRRWLHVASTDTLTHYQWHQYRGNRATEQIGILPVFEGRAVHDGLSSYHKYECLHSLCNAHHLRELIFIEERENQGWAGEMKKLLLEIKQSVEEARAKGLESLKLRVIKAYEERYEKLIQEGLAATSTSQLAVAQYEQPKKRGRKKQSKAKNLVDRLSKYREEVLAFMYDFRVPFDNNQAERDLRMMKVQQKISGCFRSEQGASYFCRIRSYISTVKKQGGNVLEMIKGVFKGTPSLPNLEAE